MWQFTLIRVTIYDDPEFNVPKKEIGKNGSTTSFSKISITKNLLEKF